MCAPTPVSVCSTDGVELVVHDHGGDGIPLLMCHATGFHGRYWDPICRRLADTFRCLAVDLRGHGDTVVPEGVSMHWHGMANDVLAVIDHFGLADLRVVGHSMGGASLVIAESMRPGTITQGWLFEPIVVPSDIVQLANESGERTSDMSETARRRREIFDSRDAAYERYASRPPFSTADPDALRAYVDHGFEDLPDGTVRLKCRRDVEAQVYENSMTDAWDRAPGVQSHLVIGGSGDGQGPAHWAPAVAERLPNGVFEDHPELTHFAPLEAPERVAAAIRGAVSP